MGVSRLTNDDVAAAGGQHMHAGHAHHVHHAQLRMQGGEQVQLVSSWQPHHHFMHTRDGDDGNSTGVSTMVIPASAELESAAVARYRRPFESKPVTGVCGFATASSMSCDPTCNILCT
eukprot:365048-Chlamydomonas_euryale.AAC.20